MRKVPPVRRRDDQGYVRDPAPDVRLRGGLREPGLISVSTSAYGTPRPDGYANRVSATCLRPHTISPS